MKSCSILNAKINSFCRVVGEGMASNLLIFVCVYGIMCGCFIKPVMNDNAFPDSMDNPVKLIKGA